jgi:hypothetical protein
MMKASFAAGLLAISTNASWAQGFDFGTFDMTSITQGVRACASQPSGCADQLLHGPLAPLVWETIGAYRSYLFNQAEGRWKALPDWFVATAQVYYPGLDLTQVRYAEEIQTVHGHHITWGPHIFFTSQLDLSRYEDVHVTLHELEHVRQYQEAGGEGPFLTQYLSDSFQAVAEAGTIDVHGQLELEQAANAAADGLAGVVFSARP